MANRASLNTQSDKVVLAGQGIDPEEWPSSSASIARRCSIAFFGSQWYPPNRTAASWFVTQCWPQVRAAVPEARLEIYGPGEPPAEVSRATGVVVEGRVTGWMRFLVVRRW